MQFASLLAAITISLVSTHAVADNNRTAEFSGTASWYGGKFHGRKTANGERFDMHQLTAAHRTLPFGSKVLVENLANGQTVVVRINDRGPFTGNRVIDLSRGAASKIGMIKTGVGKVKATVVPNGLY